MSDLISRKAVMEELLAIQDVTYMSTCLTVDECKGKRWMIARAIDAVKDAQEVDAVEVVHGHWDKGHEMMTCTNCCEQFDLYFKNDFNYCPNCGARMDEVSE